MAGAAGVTNAEERMAERNQSSERAQAIPAMDRRRFLYASSTSAGAIIAASILHGSTAAAAAPPEAASTSPGQIPRRPLGKTGEQVSIIGLGGYHLGTMRT